LGPIPLAHGARLLPGTTTVRPTVGLYATWQTKLTTPVVIDVGLGAWSKDDRICSGTHCRKSFERPRQLLRTVVHLIVQLGAPALRISVAGVIGKPLGQGSCRTPLDGFPEECARLEVEPLAE